MTRTEACFRFALLATTALSAVPALAGDALPVGGSVAHGRVAISTPGANAMAIRQSSPTAIVNWRGFSIGAGARVDIDQPSTSSAMLNRVTGSTPSSIAGQLNANGQVYLVNPNGIAITPTGTVRTGAFVASALAATDEDFLAGRRSFQGDGRSAAVVNRGAIAVGRGGYAALIGGRVENSGTISAPLGRIGLGAAERATLDVSGDGFLQVAVPSEGVDSDGGPLIDHSGRLSADGGRVEIKAASARQMARQVVNLSGVVEARSVSGRSGAIVLGGGDGGTVRVAGRLDASAPRPAPLSAQIAAINPPPSRLERGGAIVVTGSDIDLAGATVDASGPSGGTVRIGGGYQGGGDLQRARTASVDAASLITADALGDGAGEGEGGSVIVWSDERTSFEGTIRARGGPDGGDGGFAEVSGKDRLWFAGAVDLSAPHGAVGTLLLDPIDIAIVEDPDPESNDIAAATVETVLSDVDLVISTESDDADEPGNIAVDAPLAWDTGNTLTLDADNDIAINATITAPAGGLELLADGAIGAVAAVEVGLFTLAGGAWSQIAATLPAFTATDFRIEDGDGTDASFLRAVGGDGTADAPYLITDVYGLQGVGSAAGIAAGVPDLADSYALAGSIDATVTAGWNDVEGAEGFVPIGELFDGPTFQGSFQGNGFTIGGLTIDRPFESVGLFRSVGPDGTVDNVALAAPSIIGGGLVGSLAGQNLGLISRARVLGGTVTGLSPDQTVDFVLGGAIGQNFGILTQSFSTAAVAGLTLEGSVASIGGLVGTNSGTVSDSNAAGGVASVGPGIPLVGGLVGANNGEGTVIRTYATGAVSATGAADGLAGGLVGQNAGLLDQSYAAGAVTGDAAVVLGGLVGGPPDDTPAAPVFASFWDSTTTGQDASSGGGTPLTTADFQNAAVFVPQAEAAGWSFETTWAPPSAGFYPELYAISPVVRVDVDDVPDRQYGGDNPPLTSTNFGGPDVFVFGPAGDTLDVAALLTTPADATSDVGDYAITTSADEATSTGGIVYRLATTDGELTVTPAPLTITADDQFKTYGTTFVFNGTEFTTDPAQLFNGDEVTSATLTSPGAPGTAGAGTYAIDIADALGTGLENYTITYVPGAFTVDPATLVITADDQFKTYGTTFVFNGTEFTTVPFPLFNGDEVTSATLTSLGAPGTAGAGTYAIDIADALGTGLENYTITYVPGTFVVNPAPLTITADDQFKTYGTTFAFNGTEFVVDPAQLFNDDQVASATLTSSGAPGTAGAGTYVIDIADALGTGLENYTISYVPGTFVVNPAPLTITADDQFKTYGTTFAFNGTEFVVDPAQLFNDDQVASATLTSSGAPGTAGAGTYVIDIADALGTGLENYTISYVPGTFVVNPAPLTITANDQLKPFDTEFVFDGTEFVVDPDQLFNGDQVLSATLDSLGAPAAAPVGEYAISIDAAQGDGLANYDITYVPGNMEVLPLAPETLDAGLRLPNNTNLANPADVIEVSDAIAVSDATDAGDDTGGGSGGPILAAATAEADATEEAEATEDADATEEAAATETAGATEAAAAAEETLGFVAAVASTLEQRVATCTPGDPAIDYTLACVSDALSAYASQLESRILELPEPLRRVSAVIRQSVREIEGVRADTARRIARATSDAERATIEREAAARAGAAVETAVAEIRRAIQLIRAEDDPELASLQTRQGDTIAAALQNVEDELTQAVGL